MPSVQSVKNFNYHLLCLLGSWECYGVLVRTHTAWEHHVLKQMLQAQLFPVCSGRRPPTHSGTHWEAHHLPQWSTIRLNHATSELAAELLEDLLIGGDPWRSFLSSCSEIRSPSSDMLQNPFWSRWDHSNRYISLDLHKAQLTSL